MPGVLDSLMRSVATAAIALAPSIGVAGDMPKTPDEARRIEQADALPAPAFYTRPRSLARGRPGELLAAENFAGYDLPRGASAMRILYRSRDADGRDVMTSGFVIAPSGAPPAGGWPVIAFAHGTSGVGRACAPSLMKDLYYGELGLNAMVNAGFAVVATDYHGLGTPGPHQYVNKAAQVEDVMFSVPAARAALPALGSRWVAVGHSQGGLAAWGVAEAESGRHDPGYLGAVSVAGAVQLEDLLTHLGETPGVGFYLAFMAYGIHASYPAFAVTDMLTPVAMRRYAAAANDGCWYHGYALYADLTSKAMLKPGWNRNVWVQKYFKTNELGDKAVRGPLLVIAGEGDVTVPVASVRQTVARACAAGSASLRFSSYPGLDHDETMLNSVPEQLAWIRDRFAGIAPPNDCPVN